MYVDWEIEKKEGMSLKSENFFVRVLEHWEWQFPAVQEGRETTTSIEGSPFSSRQAIVGRCPP